MVNDAPIKFNTVVCGGTFDHFHKGHRSLLKLAFSAGKKVVIGVTSDSYVENSKFIHTTSSGQNSKFIEPFGKRKQAVLEFIKSSGVLSKVKIVKINDMFGQTLSKDFPIDAIVVSEDTKKGAEHINKRRKKLGLKELNLLIVPHVLAEDGKIISSRRIRNGEVNREGKLYVNPLWLKKDLMLPENLREEFKKPFGILIKDKENYGNLICPFLITVGDITSKMFNELGLNQNISVVDFYVSRHKEFSSLKDLGFSDDEEVISINNPRGHLTSDLFRAVSELFKRKKNKRIVVKIEGEEDLSVLPITLVAPLNSLIFYGQPKKGVVKVFVSEETKERAYSFINKFIPNTRGY